MLRTFYSGTLLQLNQEQQIKIKLVKYNKSISGDILNSNPELKASVAGLIQVSEKQPTKAVRHVEVFPAGPLFPFVKKYLINYSTPPSEYVLPVVASGAYLIYAHAETADLKYKHHTEKVMTCFGLGGNI